MEQPPPNPGVDGTCQTENWNREPEVRSRPSQFLRGLSTTFSASQNDVLEARDVDRVERGVQSPCVVIWMSLCSDSVSMSPSADLRRYNDESRVHMTRSGLCDVQGYVRVNARVLRVLPEV
jgi:hypothetical protein